ncbi:hypothetical protein [Nostoc sp. DedQUE09]|uniref:hypothetical protein n=1 Tax=Nostoc sp. DedQUE09 TaxID=3075394 RepID=UPI002AD4982C|nr:hypothetical protein [Nostoc sp. DedQUE09]MDZ7952312.1 hypothetical protein [Nostoc sp. DedQUE09]
MRSIGCQLNVKASLETAFRYCLVPRLRLAQYYSVKARDAMNRRLYNNQSFVLTAIYRAFVMIYYIFSDLNR